MDDALALLGAVALAGGGPVTCRFRDAGLGDLAGAARHLQRLPYGRIARREEFWRVLAEKRGTCSTKHALLAALCAEQGVAVQLTLGIYEMSERNTPGVGGVLDRHGLDAIPEAHCFLRVRGERLDVTGVPPGAEPIERFLHEEPIAVEQIGEYKIGVHRRFLAGWIAGDPAARGRTLDEVWRVREQCIAALGAGEHGTG